MSYWAKVSGLIYVKRFFDINVINKNSPFGSEGGLDFDIHSTIENEYDMYYNDKYPRGKTYLKSNMQTTISFATNLRDFEIEKIVRVETWLNGIVQHFNELQCSIHDDNSKIFNQGEDYKPSMLTPELHIEMVKVETRDILVYFQTEDEYLNNKIYYKLHKREINL